MTHSQDLYAADMRALLTDVENDREAVELAQSEMALHGHPNAPAWALYDWLNYYWYEISLARTARLLEGE